MTREMPGWWWALIAIGGVKALAGLPGFALAPSSLGPDSPFPTWVYLASLLAYTAIGFTLLLGGQRDHRALLLGGVFVLAASMSADRPLAALGAEAGLAGRIAAVASALAPGALRPLLVWMFARQFPRDALTGAWRHVATAGQSLCALVGALLFGISAWAALDAATDAALMPASLYEYTAAAPEGMYWLFVTPFTLAGTPLILLNMRAAGAADQRRAQVFVAGLVMGTAPILAQAAAEALIPAYGAFMAQPTPRFWSGVVFYPLLFGGLAVAAYSVYVSQVLSVRLVVRKAVRYAFARATLVGLMLVPFALLSWLVYQHRNEPLRALLAGPQQVSLLALVAGAALLLRVRRPLLSALDRRFFREQYDARHILRNLIDGGLSASSLETLADHLASEIDRALHVSHVTLYLADPQARALAPVAGRGEPLRVEATLATLLKGSDQPMAVRPDADSSPLARLPADERTWVERTDAHLLVPITDGRGGLAGLIALGEKKSELPFSREDRWLLSATASSAALALDHLRPRGSTPLTPPDAEAPPAQDDRDAARECPRCTTVHDPSSAHCPDCGSDLRAAAVPLTLHGLRVERRIGAGGMGVVYRALDTTLRRPVAIKTLPLLSAAHAHQLRREARAMAALSHPNLATIYSADVWRGTPMLIVEFLGGGTLQDALRQGALSIPRALALGIDLAGALEHMHAHGVLHRDIKPSNIGFTSAGTPKLLDFGLAKMAASAQAPAGEPRAESTGSTSGLLGTPSGHLLIGTPAYFSPELARFLPPDEGSDLWALALTLYEAITGANPMAARTTAETLEKVAAGHVPSLTERRIDTPPAVARCFADALSRNPAERPASARAFREALQRCGGN